MPLNSTTLKHMTKKDLAAIDDGLRAYRALLPLMHEPSNVRQVTDAIKQLEALKAEALS
tara:strand:+ start:374 stop:550 length:177 start_codon:yes stop_codon:yes gene_type:complete